MTRVITADISGAKTWDDVFVALFAAWEAPEWHGKNFNALRDSLLAGEINGIEPPFRLRLIGSATAGPEAREMVAEFRGLIGRMRSELEAVGRQVEVEIV